MKWAELHHPCLCYHGSSPCLYSSEAGSWDAGGSYSQFRLRHVVSGPHRASWRMGTWLLAGSLIFITSLQTQPAALLSNQLQNYKACTGWSCNTSCSLCRLLCFFSKSNFYSYILFILNFRLENLPLQYIYVMMFAVEEINHSSVLLPGVKLGFHIRDSCDLHPWTTQAALSLVGGDNASCYFSTPLDYSAETAEKKVLIKTQISWLSHICFKMTYWKFQVQIPFLWLLAVLHLMQHKYSWEPWVHYLYL